MTIGLAAVVLYDLRAAVHAPPNTTGTYTGQTEGPANTTGAYTGQTEGPANTTATVHW